MKIRSVIAAVAAISMCMSMTACGNSESSTEQDTKAVGGSVSENAEPKNVTLCESWELDLFYPVIHSGISGTYGAAYWNNNFYDTLVKYEDGEYKGNLAESWIVSEDGKVYTFKLREGVKFTDRAELNSEAVKKSLEAAVVNLGMYNGSFGRLTTLIESIDTPDELTIVLNLVQPYYGTLNDLTMCDPLAIVSPNALNDDLTFKEELRTQTMGTGPYMYKGDFDGSVYTFVRNPDYWGEAPEADTFKVKIIADNDAKVLALRSGEIDIIAGSSRMSADGFNELSEDPAFGTAINDEPSMTSYIGFNMTKTPFDDNNVRLAVAYAVDNSTIADNVFRGTMLPAESLFAKSKPYCTAKIAAYEYSPEKAEELLEKAGWTDSDGDNVRDKDGAVLEISLIYTSDYGSIGDAVLAIASQLEAVGFKVNVSDTDMMTYYNNAIGGNYNAAWWRTYGGVFDPYTVMTNINPEISADPVAVQFNSFLPEGMMAELDSTVDEDRIQEIYDTVLNSVADNALCVPVVYTAEYAAWNLEIINGYDFYPDTSYTDVSGIDLK
ncbi:MAG: ABC transporter substrate-binding protein [Oscillospiraceae bacterium]